MTPHTLDLREPADLSARYPVVSTVALLAANAVPLAGVVLLGWGVYPILLLYWLENVISGAFNVLRMLVSQPADRVNWLAKTFVIPFFCFHYGIFTAVHGVFVFAMFGPRRSGTGLFPTADFVRGQILATGIEYAVIAIVLSHGVSFAFNFLIGGEFRRVGAPLLMVRPYARVVVLHLVILIGGVGAQAIGSPVVAIVVLVLVKTVIDVVAHTRERQVLSTTLAGRDPFQTLRERLAKPGRPQDAAVE